MFMLDLDIAKPNTWSHSKQKLSVGYNFLIILLFHSSSKANLYFQHFYFNLDFASICYIAFLYVHNAKLQ